MDKTYNIIPLQLQPQWRMEAACWFHRKWDIPTEEYLASMDENGKISKPCLLPQEDPETYYDRSVYSSIVADFVNAPILLDTKVFEKRITSKERIQVQVGD